MDIWEFRNNIHDAANIIEKYDVVIVSQEIISIPDNKLDCARRLEIIPSIVFGAYHPDLCYARAENTILNSPLDAYNSIIAIAAYNNGLSVQDALRFYNANTYQKAGYFDMWGPSVRGIAQEFEAYGFNIGRQIINWSRTSAFMYSINHPKINCLFDIAREFLQKICVAAYSTQCLPSDNLATGAIFPVYTEIAERYGVKGDYTFKIFNKYELMNLESYVRASYASYDEQKIHHRLINVTEEFLPRYNAVSSLMTKG
ncbi:hypothetical protein GCM10023158_10590 [Gluconacetobacter tumulicola]